MRRSTRGRTIGPRQDQAGAAARRPARLPDQRENKREAVSVHSSPGQPPRPLRILIVDGHALVRRAVTALVESEPGLVVCGQATTPGEGLAAIQRLRPGLVITGLSFDAVDGLAGVQEIGLRHPGLPVLVVSMHDPAVVAERALRAGARAFVAKAGMGETLLGAIHQILGDAPCPGPTR